MPDALAGVELKLSRAKAHLVELQNALAEALDGDCKFVGEFDRQRKCYVLKVSHVPTVDPEWSILLGEIFYQLRSALDHLAWQLVEHDGGTPNKQTKFPILESLRDKNGKRMRLRQLMPQVTDSTILTILNECQPYYWSDTEGHGITGIERHPLRLLKLLSNIDKHRLLLVVVCVLDIGRMYWGLPQGVAPPSCELNPQPLKDGDEVARFDFGGQNAPNEFDPHPSLKVVIDEAEVPCIRQMDVTRCARYVSDFVEGRVLRRFQPLFP